MEILASLLPLPKITKARSRSHRPEGANVITSSPYKKVLELKTTASVQSENSTKKRYVAGDSTKSDNKGKDTSNMRTIN